MRTPFFEDERDDRRETRWSRGQPTRRRVTLCMQPVPQCSLLPTGHRSAMVAAAVMDVVAVEAVLLVVTAAFSNGCSGCLDDCVVFVS